MTGPASEDGRGELLSVREAAQPFAKLRADDGDTFASYPREMIVRCEVTVGEILALREALNRVAIDSIEQVAMGIAVRHSKRVNQIEPGLSLRENAEQQVWALKHLTHEIIDALLNVEKRP